MGIKRIRDKNLPVLSLNLLLSKAKWKLFYDAKNDVCVGVLSVNFTMLYLCGLSSISLLVSSSSSSSSSYYYYYYCNQLMVSPASPAPLTIILLACIDGGIII